MRFLKYRLSLLVLTLVFIATAAQSGEQNTDLYIPDIGTFMKIGYAKGPKIDEQGQHLFFLSNMSGVLQVYRLMENGWPYQLTVFDDGVDWYYISHDGQQAIVGASVGGNEDAQLFLMDARSGQIRQLTHTPKVRYGQAIWKKDASGFYFYANLNNPRDFNIYFYNLASDSIEQVLEMEGRNNIADLSFDEKYLLTYHSYSNVSDDIYLLDLTNGQYEMITSGKKNILYHDPILMPDNKTIYLTCNDNKNGVMKIARFHLDSKKLEYLEPESKWSIDDKSISPDRRYTVWLTNEEGYSKIKFMDMEKSEPLPVPSLSGLVSGTIVTNDGRLFFEYTNPTSTKDIWQWNPVTEQLTKMTNSIYAGIDPGIFIEPSLIKYKSFDGREIPALMYLPPDYDGQPVPFIIHAHGGPESQFRPYFQRHFQYLLLNGYGILAPNVRGSRGYGIEYLNLDNYKNRQHSIKDFKAAADFLIKKKYSQPGLLGIKGTSYGGYVVLACITEYPDLFSAAWEQVGIANFVTFLKNTREYRRHIREAEYGPLADSAFLKSISPIFKASLIKTPLMVVHGENDPRVSVDEARQIIRAINENGGQVDSLIFPDEGHGINKLSNRLTFYRKMVLFFDRHLKK